MSAPHRFTELHGVTKVTLLFCLIIAFEVERRVLEKGLWDVRFEWSRHALESRLGNEKKKRLNK